MVLAVSTAYGVALRMATLLALLFTVSVFSAGLYAWWRGLRLARWFIIAWTAFLLGGLVNTLMVLGYLPNVFITMYASQLGSHWRWHCCRWRWPTASTSCASSRRRPCVKPVVRWNN